MKDEVQATMNDDAEQIGHVGPVSVGTLSANQGGTNIGLVAVMVEAGFLIPTSNGNAAFAISRLQAVALISHLAHAVARTEGRFGPSKIAARDDEILN